ncbi:MAG: T9SS type A sorting domain-containing protein [Bacteroidota bacterium]
MKALLLILVFLASCVGSWAQISQPHLKANFGIDADLRANFINAATSTTGDDWFINGGTGTGISVIDTTGAAAITNNYLVNTSSRNQPLIRNMSVPPFSLVNARMLIDAVFVRDFHGDDSTIFASGSNKNGMNPANWVTPESQSVPDKNEILDIYMHVRRGGKRAVDSLWMFGAVSIENTTGNRYFDFEMFQTNIFYNRATNTFSGYGPDAGHTSWEFDAAGNVIKAGDIILTAEYSSSSLSLIEARIWVNSTSLSLTPTAFSWSGQFDGASNRSQYGYASILPKTEGAFYSGLQNSGTAWGGSYSIIRSDNRLVTDYEAKQFMEFSVNLTKLGLDPVTVLGGSTCSMPFQKVMVKTRASTSFTAELKDFVAPFGILNVAKADLFTTIPIFCGVIGVSNITVTNPISTSVYTWSTPNGHFADTSNKTSVYVDAPGTYIVYQKLQSTCPLYATDTLTINFNLNCGVLLSNKLAFNGQLQQANVYLKWNALQDEAVASYTIERSNDGIHFSEIKNIVAVTKDKYDATDALYNFNSPVAYYRLVVKIADGSIKHSPAIVINLAQPGTKNKVRIAPNPVISNMQLQVYAVVNQKVKFEILDGKGSVIFTDSRQIEKGNATINISGFENKPVGIYTLKAMMNNEVLVQRFLLSR